MKPLLTLKDAAEILNVSAHTVRRLVLDNELRGLKVGGQYRLREQDVAAYIDHMASATIPPWQALTSTDPVTASGGTTARNAAQKPGSKQKNKRGAGGTPTRKPRKTFAELRA